MTTNPEVKCCENPRPIWVADDMEGRPDFQVCGNCHQSCHKESPQSEAEAIGSSFCGRCTLPIHPKESPMSQTVEGKCQTCKGNQESHDRHGDNRDCSYNPPPEVSQTVEWLKENPTTVSEGADLVPVPALNESVDGCCNKCDKKDLRTPDGWYCDNASCPCHKVLEWDGSLDTAVSLLKELKGTKLSDAEVSALSYGITLSKSTLTTLVKKMEGKRKKIDKGYSTDERRYPHGFNAGISAAVETIKKMI